MVIIEASAEIIEAARLMRDRHVGDLVVVEPLTDGKGKRPIGILTDRDLVVEVMAAGVDPETLRVGDVIGPALHTAGEDSDLWESIEIMRRQGVRRIPVVDDRGLLVGILAMDGLVSLVRQEENVEVALRR